MQLTLETMSFLAATAFLAGLIDSMAGGGGLLTLPALLAAGIPPVQALATNKLQSTFGTGGAFLAFWRKGHVDLHMFWLPALGAFLGSAAGTVLVQIVDSSFLAALVPVLLILIGLYFLFAPSMSDADRKARLGRIGLTLVTTTIGFYDGFFGPGTGSFFTTALVVLGGLGLVRAIGNTKLLNFSTNLASVITMIIGGQVLWAIGFTMAAANIIGNQIGARLAMRYGGRGVRPLLVVMSFALTFKLLADPANPLRQLFF